MGPRKEINLPRPRNNSTARSAFVTRLGCKNTRYTVFLAKTLK